MKSLLRLKIVTVICLVFVCAALLAGCGNHLGIPNGDYVECDQSGAVISQTVRYTIKGKKVATHYSYENLYDFKPNGSIVKAGGGSYANDYDHFRFSYKQSTAWFGYVKTNLLLEISYDAATGILTVGELYYLKTTGGGGGPTIPSI